MVAVIFLQFVADSCIGLGRFHTLNSGTKRKFQTLFRKNFLEILSNFTVHTRCDGIEILNHLDLSPETGIDRPKLKTNDPSTNDNHFLGHFTKRQGALRGDNDFFIHFDAWQSGRRRARRNDDRFCVMDCAANLHLARRGDGTEPFDPIHLVLFEQEFDPFGVLANHIIFIGQHAFPIDLGRSTF